MRIRDEEDRHVNCVLSPFLLDFSFLVSFAKRPFTINDQIKLIHDFLEVSSAGPDIQVILTLRKLNNCLYPVVLLSVYR
jgi:hypothetical protein